MPEVAAVDSKRNDLTVRDFEFEKQRNLVEKLEPLVNFVPPSLNNPGGHIPVDKQEEFEKEAKYIKQTCKEKLLSYIRDENWLMIYLFLERFVLLSFPVDP